MGCAMGYYLSSLRDFESDSSPPASDAILKPKASACRTVQNSDRAIPSRDRENRAATVRERTIHRAAMDGERIR